MKYFLIGLGILGIIIGALKGNFEAACWALTATVQTIAYMP